MSDRSPLSGLKGRLIDKPASQSRGKFFMVGLGLFGVLALLVMVVVGFNAPNNIPGRSYYNVKAQFAEADNLTGHYQVRVSGKLVGQVLRPRVEDGKAVADLQMEPDVGPLPKDSTVEVRPRSPVGVRYIDIRPGKSKETLSNGATIPASQTSVTRQLDEAFSTFDAPTRRNSRKFFQGFGTGLAGRGEDLNQAIEDFPPFLGGLNSVLGAVAAKKGNMRALIRGSGTSADTYAPVGSEIGNGFEPQAAALRPFSDERDAVHGTLYEAPPALTTARVRLPAVDRFAAELEGFSANVRPALRAAPASFTQTSAMLRESRPGLRGLTDTVYTGRRAVNPTLRFLSDIRPVLPSLERGLSDTTPLVGELGAHGCDVVRYGRNWTSMMATGNDTGGGALRFNVVGGTFFGATDNVKIPGEGTFSNAYPKPCTAGTEKPGQPVQSDDPGPGAAQ